MPRRTPSPAAHETTSRLAYAKIGVQDPASVDRLSQYAWKNISSHDPDRPEPSRPGPTNVSSRLEASGATSVIQLFYPAGVDVKKRHDDEITPEAFGSRRLLVTGLLTDQLTVDGTYAEAVDCTAFLSDPGAEDASEVVYHINSVSLSRLPNDGEGEAITLDVKPFERRLPGSAINPRLIFRGRRVNEAVTANGTGGTWIADSWVGEVVNKPRFQ